MNNFFKNVAIILEEAKNITLKTNKFHVSDFKS